MNHRIKKPSENADISLIKKTRKPISICGYSFDDYLERVTSFHGFPSPGVVLGGVMVDAAIKKLPQDSQFSALCETSICLPDAVQLLSSCTTGNRRLKVRHLGRYALSLFDNASGKGIRVAVEPAALDKYPEIKTWLFRLKKMDKTDSSVLLQQIAEAGSALLKFQEVKIQPNILEKRQNLSIVVCPLCGEAYPREHGRICRACKGEVPYVVDMTVDNMLDVHLPTLSMVPVEEAIGRKTVHDMTRIVPGKSKGAAFKRGSVISATDICRLHQMGRQHVYVIDGDDRLTDSQWIHEDDVAQAFARVMAGDGVIYREPPAEGKITFTAARDGLLVIDESRLEMLNRIPGVMCATRKNFTTLTKGHDFAGTRAIPLFLHRSDFEKAMAILDEKPLFQVNPLKALRVGILVTGTEVFTGVIQDKFIPIIQAKVTEYGCDITRAAIVPDDVQAIVTGIKEIVETGADLMVTTAGLSVDPDDVTRQGLVEAGAADMLYGAPILPGAMTLLCRIGHMKVFGVPACALFFKTTSFDLLLPRILADIPVTRNDLARMGHGAFCQQCKTCTYPKCAFGK